jgi:hypothetical protein
MFYTFSLTISKKSIGFYSGKFSRCLRRPQADTPAPRRDAMGRLRRRGRAVFGVVEGVGSGLAVVEVGWGNPFGVAVDAFC